MSLSENSEKRIALLREQGCEVTGPEPVEESGADGGTAHRFHVRLPDGESIEVERETADEAVEVGLEEAERTLHPVDEASKESFPASDPPSY